MAEIKVENLQKEFGVGDDRVVALENVNLAISRACLRLYRGPLRVRQVDAAQHPQRHRDAEQRAR